MAYKKRVQGRSYPFLYNVSSPVGALKSLKKQPKLQYADFEKVDPKTGQPTGEIISRPYMVGVETHLTSKYQPNKRDDVMLVQYLLKRIYQLAHLAQPPLSSSVSDPHSPAALTIDGVYGPKTQSAIERFQLEMRRNKNNIATDGCVDPEKGASSLASISQTVYTISWLNEYFWKLYPTLASDIRLDPECPMELKQAVT